MTDQSTSFPTKGIIRKARAEDLPELLRVYEAAREFMVKTGNPTQWISPDGKTKPTKEQLEMDIAQSKSYVYTDALGRIHAVFYYDYGQEVEPTYGKIDPARGLDNTGKWIGPETYGVVHRIASDGLMKGAGRTCLRWAMDQSAHLRIDTHENNRPMQHVLGQLGFALCGTIYLEDGDSRLAYEWVKDES